MRHVPLVVASFETLSEADGAVRAVLDSGYGASAIAAAGRAGGGRLLLAGRVGVQPVDQPAQLVDRGERGSSAATSAGIPAAVTVLIAALLFQARGIEPLPALQAYVYGPLLAAGAALSVGVALGVLAALSQAFVGLPHMLAVRLSRGLDRGDVALAVRVRSAREAQSVRETLTLSGASEVHVTRGYLKSRAPQPSADEDADVRA